MSSSRASERIETASYPSRLISSMAASTIRSVVSRSLGAGRSVRRPLGSVTRTRTGPACQVRSRSGGFVGSGMTNNVLDTNVVRF